jgi:hypothetical protein
MNETESFEASGNATDSTVSSEWDETDSEPTPSEVISEARFEYQLQGDWSVIFTDENNSTDVDARSTYSSGVDVNDIDVISTDAVSDGASEADSYPLVPGNVGKSGVLIDLINEYAGEDTESQSLSTLRGPESGESSYTLPDPVHCTPLAVSIEKNKELPSKRHFNISHLSFKNVGLMVLFGLLVLDRTIQIFDIDIPSSKVLWERFYHVEPAPLLPEVIAEPDPKYLDSMNLGFIEELWDNPSWNSLKSIGGHIVDHTKVQYTKVLESPPFKSNHAAYMNTLSAGWIIGLNKVKVIVLTVRPQLMQFSDASKGLLIDATIAMKAHLVYASESSRFFAHKISDEAYELWNTAGQGAHHLYEKRGEYIERITNSIPEDLGSNIEVYMVTTWTHLHDETYPYVFQVSRDSVKWLSSKTPSMDALKSSTGQVKDWTLIHGAEIAHGVKITTAHASHQAVILIDQIKRKNAEVDLTPYEKELWRLCTSFTEQARVVTSNIHSIASDTASRLATKSPRIDITEAKNYLCSKLSSMKEQAGREVSNLEAAFRTAGRGAVDTRNILVKSMVDPIKVASDGAREMVKRFRGSLKWLF